MPNIIYMPSSRLTSHPRGAEGHANLPKAWPAAVWDLRLGLQGIGYIQIRFGSDPLWYGPLCLHGTGSNWNGSICGHLHKWTHLVPDNRSDSYRIHQVSGKHKAYPYQLRTGSKRIRSRVNPA